MIAIEIEIEIENENETVKEIGTAISDADTLHRWFLRSLVRAKDVLCIRE